MVQEVQVVMDTKVKTMNEELDEHRQSLQVCHAWIVCLYLGENHQGSMLEYGCVSICTPAAKSVICYELRPSKVVFCLCQFSMP